MDMDQLVEKQCFLNEIEDAIKYMHTAIKSAEELKEPLTSKELEVIKVLNYAYDRIKLIKS